MSKGAAWKCGRTIHAHTKLATLLAVAIVLGPAPLLDARALQQGRRAERANRAQQPGTPYFLDDLCGTPSCSGQGQCRIDASSRNVFCECFPGFLGPRCEGPSAGEVRSNCEPNPCQQFWTCQLNATDPNGYQCLDPCRLDPPMCIAPFRCMLQSQAPGFDCVAPTCSDGIKSWLETGTDCGGRVCVAEGKACPAGAPCLVAEDCKSGLVCLGSHPTATGYLQCKAPTCGDGARNGQETGIDCGGRRCVAEGKACPAGAPCLVGADCESGLVCLGAHPTAEGYLQCKAPSCSDGVKNGQETGIDCGGGGCVSQGRTCPDGAACLGAGDCSSGRCSGAHPTASGYKQCQLSYCPVGEECLCKGSNQDCDCPSGSSCQEVMTLDSQTLADKSMYICANSVITGTSGNDGLVGTSGVDVIYGGAGNDQIDGGGGTDFLYGDAGNDNIVGSAGKNVMFGGGGNDILNSNTAGDTQIMSGGAGSDTLKGGAANDLMAGGDGDDTMEGMAGNDLMAGGAGLDTVSGFLGDDTLYGGTEDDTLTGNEGADKLYGGDGSDTLVGDPSEDTVLDQDGPNNP